MTYIVKADIPACNGQSCRVCEMYLEGFFSEDGGVTIADEPVKVDAAEMAEQFCPMQCITMEAVSDEQL